MKFRTVHLTNDEWRALDRALELVTYEDQIRRTMTKRAKRGSWAIRFERRYTEVMVEALELQFPYITRPPVEWSAPGTVTGRFSASKPNFANVPPARTPASPKIPVTHTGPLLAGSPGGLNVYSGILDESNFVTTTRPLLRHAGARPCRDKLQPRHPLERLATEG